MIIQEKSPIEEKPLEGSSIVFDWGNTLVFDPFDTLLPIVSEKAVAIAQDRFQLGLDKKRFSEAWGNANSVLNFQFASHFSQEEPWIQAGLKEAGVPDDIRVLLGPQILAEYRSSFRDLLQNDP